MIRGRLLFLLFFCWSGSSLLKNKNWLGPNLQLYRFLLCVDWMCNVQPTFQHTIRVFLGPDPGHLMVAAFRNKGVGAAQNLGEN